MALTNADLPKLLELLNSIDIRVQVRRKTAAGWTSSNEVLLQGEIGLETDTGKFKFGDGSTAWNSLAYAFTPVVGKHAVPIMAASMAPSATGGCAALATTATSANKPDLSTLNFDPATEEYAQFAIPMPKSWNEGTITALFRWSHPAATTNFGVVWGIQAVAVSDGDAVAATYGTAQTVADTGGATDTLYVSSETGAITVGGSPAAADTVYFRVYRKAADGSDTLAVDARLHSVVLFLTTDAGNDA